MLLQNHDFLRLALPPEGDTAPAALDADGFPVARAPRFSDPVPCSWRYDTFDATAEADGEPRTAQGYRFLLEWSEEAQHAQQVLFQGQVLRVIEARPLRAVRKFLVRGTSRAGSARP